GWPVHRPGEGTWASLDRLLTQPSDAERPLTRLANACHPLPGATGTSLGAGCSPSPSMQRLGSKFALVCAVLTALTLAVAGGYRFRGRPSGPVDRASIDQMRLKLHEVTRQWVLKQDYE